MAEPWMKKCADCANVRFSQEGRIWKCKVVRVNKSVVYIGSMAYAAEARAPGAACGPDATLFVRSTNGSGVPGKDGDHA